MRHITQNGINLIKRFEGFSAHIYICPAGYPTIGYGHVVKEHEQEIFKNGITEEQAEELLRLDVQEAGRAFRTYAVSVGLGWITPHVLRHTGATLMAQQGVSIWEIAGIMGDRVDTVEKHYLKHHPDYLKDATNALDRIYA